MSDTTATTAAADADAAVAASSSSPSSSSSADVPSLPPSGVVALDAPAFTCGVSTAGSPAHRVSLLFLHGLGDDGEGWRDTLALRLCGARRRHAEPVLAAHLRVTCPNAAERPVTVNFGTTMGAWYDILSLDKRGAEDAAGIERAVAWVHWLLDNEHRAHGVPYSRIFLGGFSQGGALALAAATRFSHRLAGVVALSAYMPLASAFDGAAMADDARATPVHMAHGDADTVVSIEFGQSSAELLKAKAHMSDVVFHRYPGLAHADSKDEMLEVARWMAARVADVDVDTSLLPAHLVGADAAVAAAGGSGSGGGGGGGDDGEKKKKEKKSKSAGKEAAAAAAAAAAAGDAPKKEKKSKSEKKEKTGGDEGDEKKKKHAKAEKKEKRAKKEKSTTTAATTNDAPTTNADGAAEDAKAKNDDDVDEKNAEKNDEAEQTATAATAAEQ